MNRPVFTDNVTSRVRALADFIKLETGCPGVGFDVSAPKRDGTVFVRFRSCTEGSAFAFSQSFCEALEAYDVQFTQPEDCKFRLLLSQFVPAHSHLYKSQCPLCSETECKSPVTVCKSSTI